MKALYNMAKQTKNSFGYSPIVLGTASEIFTCNVLHLASSVLKNYSVLCQVRR